MRVHTFKFSLVQFGIVLIQLRLPSIINIDNQIRNSCKLKNTLCSFSVTQWSYIVSICESMGHACMYVDD